MIAEPPTTLSPRVAQQQRAETAPPISLQRITAALQVVLATRRAARNDDHAYWYTVLRGM